MDWEKFLKLAGLGVGVLLAGAKTVQEVEKWIATREERQRKAGGSV